MRLGDEGMLIKKKWMAMFAMITAVLILSACGGSIESKIIGSWKAVVDENTMGYIEIGEERLINREESTTAEYILTEMQDGNFLLEIVNPESGSNVFLFEGYFENKDKIIVVETTNGTVENSAFIRVKNIEEDQEKEEKRLKEEEEKELAKSEEKREQEERENELEKEEEERLREEKEKVEVEKQAMEETIIEDSLKQNYLQKAGSLEEEIITEAKKLYAHDMVAGFYGQYFDQWDDLLQEVWEVLKDTMTGELFAALKTEQIEWIEMKERNFAEMPADAAVERAQGMDYLAYETRDRVYYLIDNYID